MEGRQTTLAEQHSLYLVREVETQHPSSVQPPPPRGNPGWKKQKASPEQTRDGWVYKFCTRHQGWLPKCLFGYNSAIEGGRENNCAVCVTREVRDHHSKNGWGR